MNIVLTLISKWYLQDCNIKTCIFLTWIVKFWCVSQVCSDAAELGHSCDLSSDVSLRRDAEAACHRLKESPFSHCHHQVRLKSLPLDQFTALTHFLTNIWTCSGGSRPVYRHVSVSVLQSGRERERYGGVRHVSQLRARVCDATRHHPLEDRRLLW